MSADCLKLLGARVGGEGRGRGGGVGKGRERGHQPPPPKHIRYNPVHIQYSTDIYRVQ
jgi:hypothetical protein